MLRCVPTLAAGCAKKFKQDARFDRANVATSLSISALKCLSVVTIQPVSNCIRSDFIFHIGGHSGPVIETKERRMNKARNLEVLRWRQNRQQAMVQLLKKMHRGGFEPKAFETGCIDVQIAGLDPAFHGYRIASIGDIHLDEWLNAQRFGEVIDLVNEQKPDLVAIVGDLFSYEVDGWSGLMVAALSKLRPGDCSVAVLGNHDHWAGAPAVRRVLRQAGVVDLSNDVVTIRRRGAPLHVAGVDSVASRKNRLDKVLQKLPPSGPAILLVHEPDFADESASTRRFGLQISGHSHGGQWIVPGIGPPIRGLYSRKYPLGRYRVGDMTHYTNRGIGTSIIRMRINCPPEITVFTLLSRSKP